MNSIDVYKKKGIKFIDISIHKDIQ